MVDARRSGRAARGASAKLASTSRARAHCVNFIHELQAYRRVGGFWYGPRDEDGNAGQRAAPGERVVYHLHGGAHTVSSRFELSVSYTGIYDLR